MQSHGVSCNATVLVMDADMAHVKVPWDVLPKTCALASAIPGCSGTDSCRDGCFFLRCFTRETVWPGIVAAAGLEKDLDSTFVNFLVANRATATFGNFFSSMGTELVMRQLIARRTGVLYNRLL